MTRQERERSYEYYKQWQMNKSRYRTECVAYVLMFGFGLIFILKHWQGILWGIGIFLVVGAVYLFAKVMWEWYKSKAALSDLKKMAEEAGAKDIEIDTARDRIYLTLPSDEMDGQLEAFGSMLADEGFTMHVTHLNNEETDSDDMVQEEVSPMKSTEAGYVNRNHQRNNGTTNLPGTDNNQMFYDMECLSCGYKYRANGSDIWLRKCPKCQGGKP